MTSNGKANLVWFIFVAVCVVSVFAADAKKKADDFSDKPPRVLKVTPQAQEIFPTIKFGMTTTEVIQRIGPPTRIVSGCWVYENAGYVEFNVFNKVTRTRPGIPPQSVFSTGMGPGLSRTYEGPPIEETSNINSSVVRAAGYRRTDGTYVAPYYRTVANDTLNDNFSTRGNVNPYTGKPGTKPRDGEYSASDRVATVYSEQAQRSHAQLIETVALCERLMSQYTHAAFGKRPFTGDEYDKIKRVYDIAKGELSAGH